MTAGSRLRRPSSSRLIALPGLALAGVLMTASQAAAAGCVVPGMAAFAPATTAFVAPRAAAPAVSQGNGNGNASTIVGMWHVIYTATFSTPGPIPVPVIPPGPPDSFTFVESMKTWHADGTEWEEKIQPAPAGYCFGVWKHGDHDTVKLRHFGAITGSDGAVMAIFWIDEVDRVAPAGTTYSGTWDFRLYGPTDVFGTGPLLQEISGTMAATRITVQ
jgi:hypothetical protein